MKISDSLEVFVPTHIVNADSDPYIENKMIEETILSCHSSLNLEDTRFVVGPDSRFETSHPELMKEYFSYLIKMKERLINKGINVHIRKENSPTLRRNWEQFFKECKKPYMFFLEHDWKFLKSVATADIIDFLNNYKQINYLRLPKIDLTDRWFDSMCTADNWDWICEEVKDTNIPLTRISFMSGNPHFLRVDFAKKFVIPNLIKFTPYERAKGRSHLEKDLKNTIMSMIDEERDCGKIKEWGHVWPLSAGPYVGKGCPKCAHAIVSQHIKWGTFMYGKRGEKAIVGHLGDWCAKC